MSKTIARLLDKPEELVESMVKKLEDLNGSPSEDVRLVANNLQKLRLKISQLGLDPDDTTSEELYHALRSKFVSDSNEIDLALGVSDDTSASERAAKASQLVTHLHGLPQQWLIKPSAAKAIIRQLPPKKLMKQLNYHSVDSLLKREHIENIYLGAGWLESEAWRSKLAKKVSKLNSANFEMRQLHPTSLSEGYYKNTTGPSSHIIVASDMGVAALWPSGLSDGLQVLSMAAALLSGLEELAGADLSSNFCELSPALRWWSDNSHLISHTDSQRVSLNLKDVAYDLINGRDYDSRTNHHAARALFNKLLAGYQNQSEKVADNIKAIGYSVNNVSNNAPPGAFGAQLAAEYEMAG